MEPVRIDLDLILALVPAYGGYLGHARHACERVAEIEVLERPQLGEVVASRLVH
jgi:hypothetical protein